MNLRRLAEKDLKITLEGDFAEPVVLIQPDGIIVDKAVDGSDLKGKIARNRTEASAEGEGVYIVYAPVVWLRRSSLARVPKAGEVWGVKIPETPVEGAPMKQFLLDKNYAPKGGLGLGRIRLPLVGTEDVEAAA